MEPNFNVKLPSKVKAPDNIPNIQRLLAFFAGFLLIMTVIVGKLWYLQVMMNSDYILKAELAGMHGIRKLAARGVITDSNDVVLATNHMEYNVTIIPDEINKHLESLDMLATLLRIPLDQIKAKLHFNKKGKIKQQPNPILVFEKLDMETLTRIEEMKSDLVGVQIEKVPVRLYSDDNRMYAHIIGRMGPIDSKDVAVARESGYLPGDKIGVSGLENSYDVFLRGKDGSQNLAVDSKGRTLNVLNEISPQVGYMLRLSIDLKLQQAAYEGLQDALYHGHPGSAVAMDVNTGAVLAMVSLPTYNLNTYNKDYENIKNDKLKPEINRASGSSYPCGSTYKLITAAAGLETKTIWEGSYFECPGYLKVGNRKFKCDGTHGSIGFDHAIGASCDVYFYHVGMQVGKTKLAEWAQKFGLGQKTGIDIPTDYAGVVPTEEWKRKKKLGAWVEGDLVNMSIGQGFVGVTPLQLCDYTAAIANGGTLWTPQLLKEMIDVSGDQPQIIKKLTPVSRGSLGLKPQNRAAIIRGMRQVVHSGGTAAGIAMDNLDFAGKTGSAETGIPGDKTHSVFVCFAPVDHPKIAIAVFAEKAGHGSDVAAPVARRMLQQYFNLKKDNGEIRSVSGAD